MVVGMRTITLLSDFGMDNGYVAQMKGVISGISDARIIDVSHEVTPHAVREAAFILQTIVSYYPVGTVHVAVVDPGVGTDRRGIIVTTRSHVLVGPDNGVLIPAARFLGDFVVYEITNKEYMLKEISNTFQGRDVFAPVAAYITKGVVFDAIGKKITDYIDLDFGHEVYSENTVSGKIIFIDRFGNIITNISGVRLKDRLSLGKHVTVSVNNQSHQVLFVKSYGFVGKGELLATIGSSHYLEISMNQGNAAQILSVKEDDEIKIIF
ncbi:MAG: S-adenosyl-l-methionine hydroxide adenosyltransferase family protein [Euryarchaeota archaeon]|nr:S-adenosyl-l-methionine hydroxide adenosyltransferase family protein [Euryarchaeota archaeon]